MLQFIQALGRLAISAISATIENFFSILATAGEGLLPRYYLYNLWQQLMFVGFYSLPIVGMTAFFSGAVMALQTYTGFARFAAESTIPLVVTLSITRELAPVLTALMVTARVGASFAAELATMRVTEQIDALYTLSTNSIKFLITPRILATVISLPLLVLVADSIGVMGGYIVGIYKLDFNSSNYIINTFNYLNASDVYSGLVKAFAFGLVISSTSCYFGYKAKDGARGVGLASTNAVVASSVLILLSNYLITELLF